VTFSTEYQFRNSEFLLWMYSTRYSTSIRIRIRIRILVLGTCTRYRTWVPGTSRSPKHNSKQHHCSEGRVPLSCYPLHHAPLLSHACDSGDATTECLLEDLLEIYSSSTKITDVQDDTYLCVYVPRGETAKFLLKDGTTCSNARDDISVFGGLGTASTVSCQPSKYTLS
jgi:hypothetical protein